MLAGGASYSLLVIPSTITHMSLPLLRKLRALVDGGARIIAPRPQGAPGLLEGAEYGTLVAQLWGATDGRSVTGNAVGKGKVFWGREVADVMEEIKLAPDVMLSAPQPDSTFVSAHRRSGSTDIYFVANQKQRAEQLKASFRIHGARPELWYPDSGRIAPASYVMRDGRTLVDLDLEAQGSVFVVFRAPTTKEKGEHPRPREQVAATVAGPWTLQLPGDARPLALRALASWSTFEQPRLRYFSGTASYRTSLAVPKAWLGSGQRVLLDLGEVDVMAQVSINGKPAGGLWKAPYQADITALVKPGQNIVEVKVTNLWANRLIGDAAADGGTPTTFTTFKPYARPGAKLMPSGLLGPVRVMLQSDGEN